MIKGNDERSWGTLWQYRNDPVFEVDFEKSTVYPNGDKLPNIWVTEPILMTKGIATDAPIRCFIRILTTCFPTPDPFDSLRARSARS